MFRPTSIGRGTSCADRDPGPGLYEEIDRSGDETQFMRLVVQGAGHFRVGLSVDDDLRAQQDRGELTGATRLLPIAPCALSS